jgi:hypothetical protein
MAFFSRPRALSDGECASRGFLEETSFETSSFGVRIVMKNTLLEIAPPQEVTVTPEAPCKPRWSDISDDDSTDVDSSSRSDESSESDSEERTTLLLKRLSKGMRCAELLALLRRLDLRPSVDFIYLPLDLQKNVAFGFAFVNLTSHEAAVQAKEQLGSSGIEVEWCAQQGLATHVERYRNSPIMHASVAKDAQPRLLSCDGMLPFPEPSVELQAPSVESSKTKRQAYKARKAAKCARAVEGQLA